MHFLVLNGSEQINLDFINCLEHLFWYSSKKMRSKNCWLLARWSEGSNVYFDHGNEFLSQFCYSLMYLMLLLFWLRPNLANKYSKIFSFIARARTFKALGVNFLSAYFFQEYQDKCSSAINEVKIDLLSKKSYFFTKRARVHFCSDPFKTKNCM